MKNSVFSTRLMGLFGSTMLLALFSCTKEEIKPVTETVAPSFSEFNSGQVKPTPSIGAPKADSEVYPGTFNGEGEDENGPYIECKNTQSICFIVVRPNTSSSVIQTPLGDIDGDILDGQEIRDPLTGDTKWYYELH